MNEEKPSTENPAAEQEKPNETENVPNEEIEEEEEEDTPFVSYPRGSFFSKLVVFHLINFLIDFLKIYL